VCWTVQGRTIKVRTSRNTSPVANEDLSTTFRRFRIASGSIAWALSSMVTILSGMAYYDQLPRFRNFDEIHSGPLHNRPLISISMEAPQHHGCCKCTPYDRCDCDDFILRKTRYTLLGKYWQVLAQIQTPEILDLSGTSANATDKEFRAGPGRKWLQPERFKFRGSSMMERERDGWVEA